MSLSNKPKTYRCKGPGRKNPAKPKRIEERIQFRLSGTAPPPNKDFAELIVYDTKVTWRKWRIKDSIYMPSLVSLQHVSLK